MALGFGKRFNSVYTLDYMHGLVREETGGATIVTIALKNNFDIHRFSYGKNYVDFYGGITVFHVTGLRYQAARVNAFPEQYYSVGSIRGLFFLGLKGGIKESSPHQVFFESGMNDIWLINVINNNESIDYKDYVSLALGYNYIF